MVVWHGLWVEMGVTLRRAVCCCGLPDRIWRRDENHYVQSGMRWSGCLNGHWNARRMQASSWHKDTSSGQANERVGNVVDAAHVALVLDGDVETDLRCVDVVNA